MELFRIEVGHNHEVELRNIVGAIANEAGLDAQNIGRIDIQDDHSFVELPTGMPKPIFADLKKAWVCGQKLNITRVYGNGAKATSDGRKANRKNRPVEGGRHAQKTEEEKSEIKRRASEQARSRSEEAQAHIRQRLAPNLHLLPQPCDLCLHGVNEKLSETLQIHLQKHSHCVLEVMLLCYPSPPLRYFTSKTLSRPYSTRRYAHRPRH